MEYFGKILRELRKEKNLSQKQLGQIFNVSYNAIYGWENNKQEPDLETLKTIAQFFDVTSDYLIGLENEDGTKTKIVNNSFNNVLNSNIKF